MGTLESLLQQIKEQPEALSFEQVIRIIDAYYQYTPRQFSNGRWITPRAVMKAHAVFFPLRLSTV